MGETEIDTQQNPIYLNKQYNNVSRYCFFLSEESTYDSLIGFFLSSYLRELITTQAF